MVLAALPALVGVCGCEALVRTTDRDVAAAISARQRQLAQQQVDVVPGRGEPIPEPDRSAYAYAPGPGPPEVPRGFERREEGGPVAPVPGLRERAESGPAGAGELRAMQAPASARVPSSTEPAEEPGAALVDREQIRAQIERRPQRFRERVFTLTDALGYAQQHQRAYQSAKEDLYLAALALTLERHLWTPQFSGELRTVYGNFGEVTDFDQAMRFVADLGVAQRLPYGGDFTARAVSTLIRDVKRTITASESSQVQLGLNLPLLRGAGHVAREDLIQLERDLTYAVRDFERFRRRQLVDVARNYFDLLRSKQAVLDGQTSLGNAVADYERAAALMQSEQATPLDVGRAEQRLLAESNRLAQLRESFRADVDQFKILIGMPVSEEIGLGDLEDIESIEAQIAADRYPMLHRPAAVDDEQLAVETAERLRLDLANLRDQIEDARRGVAVARNALLPELSWLSTLTFDTDPEHFRLGGFEVARATWRSEVILSMNDRFAERNRFRAALIDVRRAARLYEEQAERVRAEVLAALNQIRLQEELVEIQRRNLLVAAKQREFAELQFLEGLIDNRDKVEAEDAYVRAQNDLNLAKTSRWTALLQFRLATDTLRVDESGAAAAEGR